MHLGFAGLLCDALDVGGTEGPELGVCEVWVKSCCESMKDSASTTIILRKGIACPPSCSADEAFKHPYFPIPVSMIFCVVPSTASRAVRVPLAVGLKVSDRVQAVPASRVRPQSLVWVKLDGSFPDIVGAEIVTAA